MEMNGLHKIGLSLLLVLALLPFASAQTIGGAVNVNTDAMVTTPTLGVITATTVTSIDTRLGVDAVARAQRVDRMRDRAIVVRDRTRAEILLGDEVRIAGVDDDTRRELIRLGINREQFERMVPPNRRTEVIARIRLMNADRLEAIRADHVRRVELAARLDERARVLDRTQFDSDLDQMIARVELALAIANREGRTEVAAKLQVLLDRLNNAKEDGEEPTETDREDTDRITWEANARQLNAKATEAINAAMAVEAHLDVLLERIDGLDARLRADNRFEGRSEAMLIVGTRLDGKLEASIEEAKSAQATFAATPTPANARLLMQALVKMDVLADLAAIHMRNYVSFFNRARDTDATDDDVERMTRRVREVDEDALVAAEVNARVTQSATFGTA